jgi:hypothetical protein
MNKRLVVMIAFAAFAVGCFASTLQLVVPPARAQDARRFDHVCAFVGGGSGWSKESLAQGTSANVRQYGAQGWELVTMDQNFFACFKRPL